MKLVAQLSGPEDNKAPHLRAIHFAAEAVKNPHSPAQMETWLFLRGFREEHEASESKICVVNLSVNFDTEWACLVFPHSHEAVIEDIQTERSEKFTWNEGCLRRDDPSRQGNHDSMIMRVRMRSVTTGNSHSQDVKRSGPCTAGTSPTAREAKDV